MTPLAELVAPDFEVDATGALALVLAAFGLPPEAVVPVEAPELTRSDVARLLACWKAWAKAPGSARAANALEDACRLVARKRGASGSAVRLWVLENLAPLGLDAEA